MDVIGDLLRSSLLSDLGDDEARVEKVRAAGDAMADEFLGASRPLVPAAVIAGLDEHTSADSTVLTAATEHLFAQWETFRVAFADTPIEVLRSVTLAAVEAAAASDESAVLQAAWYTARTATEQIAAGRWSGPVVRIIDAWHRSVDAAIADIWVPQFNAVTVRMPGLLPTADKKLTVDSPLRGQAAGLDPNWQTFAQQLAPTFAQYVDGLLNAAEVVGAEAQRRAVAQVKDFTKELGGRLRGAIGAQEQALRAIHLRTDLLWWRQSRYSDRLGVSYTELGSTADVAIAAAHDLHLRVPAIAPVSVEHVLADLVHETAPKTSPLGLAELEAASEASALRSSEPSPPSPSSLLDAVAMGIRTPVLADSAELPPGRAAVILFRDLQARRLATAPPPGPEEPTE